MQDREQLLERLNREGRYQEYLRRKNELLADGHSLASANLRLEDEFSPLYESDLSATVQEFAGSDEGDPIKAVEWVGRWLGVDGLDPGQAPSPLAWSLYKWARYDEDNTSAFYKSIWTRIMPSKTDVEKEADRRDDGRTLKMIDRLLSIAKRARQNAGLN